MVIALCFLIGIVAGLRAMIAPAAVSWAAWLGWIDLSGTWLSFLGHAWTPWILTLVAIAELVSDQLPSTPSRKVPVQFGTRIVMGGFAGLALGMAAGSPLIGLVAGIVGAVAGTLGGAEFRRILAGRFGRDLPAALVEDAVAVVGAALVVGAM